MALIKLNDVTKKYNEKIILNKFNLEIQEGEFISIMGTSGRGKSTLLNIIGLLEGFNDGTLTIDGETNIKPNSSKATRLLREKISYLFQNFALIDDETVEYNLSLAQKYVIGTKKEKREKLKESLNFVGLPDFEKRKIYELSGGEQQRVSIARIILKPSKIILADEPTGSLDEKNRNMVLNLLLQLNKLGKAIILVTHDKYVANYAQRLISL